MFELYSYKKLIYPKNPSCSTHIMINPLKNIIIKKIKIGEMV